MVGVVVVAFAVYVVKGGVEGFGDGLEAVVDRPAHRQGCFAVPGFAGFAEFFAACGYGNIASQVLLVFRQRDAE